MTRKRATQAIHNHRVEMVMDFLVAGTAIHKIITFLLQNEGISKRQAERYVKEAQATIGGFCHQPSDYSLGLALKRSENLIFTANRNKNFQEILQANKFQLDVLKLPLAGGKKNEPPIEATGPSPEMEDALRALSENW